MKKITTLLIACLVALQAFNAMAITTSDYVIDEGTLTGDVNGDGSVTSADISQNKINH